MRWLAGVLLVAGCGCNALTGLSDNEYDQRPTPVCEPGFADCDGRADNGCEADVQSDANRCGDTCQQCPISADSYPVCVEGVCGISCNSGFADCDGLSEDGCEVSLDKDAESCGACGRSCEGGACEVGECQPVQVASSTSSIAGLAASSAVIVFITSDGELAQVPVTGGTKTTLVLEPDRVFAALAVSGSRAAWMTPELGGLDPYYCLFLNDPSALKTSIRAIDLDTALVTPIQETTLCYDALALDEASVYATHVTDDGMAASHVLERFDAPGVPPAKTTSLAIGSISSAQQTLAVDEQTVFWASDGRVHRLPKSLDDAAMPIVESGAGPLALDTTDLFYSGAEGLERVAKVGGTPIQVAGAFGGVIALDDQLVYWAGDGGVWRARKDGTQAIRLLPGISASFLAVRDGRLFFASSSAIYKLVLPPP